MSIWISEQAFSRLQIRDKMSVTDGTRTTNLVMACNLMFLYSQYRLIGIAHQQATKPMTEQEANERACLLNGLFNADLNGYDFLTTSETAVDDAIDRYQDFQKLLQGCRGDLQVSRLRHSEILPHHEHLQGHL